MTAVVLYFQVHQPWRLAPFSFFDIGRREDPFDDVTNGRILRRVARKCYLPATRLLARLVERTRGRFRCAFSITGTAIDQLERWAPEALAGFRDLAATGACEVLGETSHHSLAFVADPREFRAQARAHRDRIQEVFGVRPRTFRNTELAYDDRVARTAESLGYGVLLAEGADHLLGARSPHRAYRAASCRRLRVLLRSYRLSDDIAFRFTDRGWHGWPLTPEKFAGWIAEIEEPDGIVGLFMDFETAGEHQSEESGILRFLEGLPDAVARRPGLSFATPSEAAAAAREAPPLDCPRPVSWADAERDLSAWLGNDLQRAAHRAHYDLLPDMRRRARRDPALRERWRRLSTSDHYYYMCTKHWSDGAVHKYFSPYASPHEAFANFMNALDDLARRVGAPAPRLAVPEPVA